MEFATKIEKINQIKDISVTRFTLNGIQVQEIYGEMTDLQNFEYDFSMILTS